MAYYNYLCKDTAEIVNDYVVENRKHWKRKMDEINSELKEVFEETSNEYFLDYFVYGYGGDLFEVLNTQIALYKRNLNFINILKHAVPTNFKFNYTINWDANFD